MSERELPAREPREIAAGETPRWTKTLADFPASEGWALAYNFRGPGAGFDVDATADGDDFLVEVPAASTEGLTAGRYFWQAWVSKDDERYRVGSGETRVRADFAEVDAGATVDDRSEVKKTLDAIDAMIAGKATTDQQQYTIAGGGGYRMLMRIPLADLLSARKEYARLYAQELRRERVRRGGNYFQSVNMRFERPK